MKASIRRNTISGDIPIDGLFEGSALFNEWNNGEGFDIEIYNKKGETQNKFSLHHDEMEAIAIIGEMFGMIDSEEVSTKSKQFLKDEQEHIELIKQFKGKI